jgi:formin-binding protein 1
MEPDDGSGWVKVVDDRGRSGLVPASYLEHDVQATPPPKASSQGGSGQYGNNLPLKSMYVLIGTIVRAIYPYEAQGDDELSFKEGELIELTSGPTGGQHYGDGWWEGRCLFFLLSSLLVLITIQGLLRKVKREYSLATM